MYDKLHKDVICTEFFYKLVRKHEGFFFQQEVLHLFRTLTRADKMWFSFGKDFVNIISSSF